jgi:hypothetical protein
VVDGLPKDGGGELPLNNHPLRLERDTELFISIRDHKSPYERTISVLPKRQGMILQTPEIHLLNLAITAKEGKSVNQVEAVRLKAVVSSRKPLN